MFPSDNDYGAYESFFQNTQTPFYLNNQAFFDVSGWRDNFQAYVIGSDGVLRQFDPFDRPDFLTGSVPVPGTPEHDEWSNAASKAKADAVSTCTGG